MSTTTQSLTDDLARTAIRAYLVGVKPDIDPAECGQWADRVQVLADAFARGGQARVIWEFNLMSDDLDMAVLLADELPIQGGAILASCSPRALNIQFMLDQGANDEGNAQCMHALYGQEFVYTNAYGYLWWTGTHWTSDGAEEALGRAATYTLKQRCILAARGGEKYAKIMGASIPTARHVRDCLYLFQMNVAVDIREFDCAPELLNCANGVLNLTTGQLTPHAPSQRFTYCLPVEYDPNAD